MDLIWVALMYGALVTGIILIVWLIVLFLREV